MQGRQLLGTERTQTYDDIVDGRDKRGLDTVPTLSFWTDRMSLESDRTLGPWRPVDNVVSRVWAARPELSLRSECSSKETTPL